MSLLRELRIYEEKIVNYEKEELDGIENERPKIQTKIDFLITYWDRFQTYYNHLLEEAELTPSLSHLKEKAEKMNENAKAHYLKTMKLLNDMFVSAKPIENTTATSATTKNNPVTDNPTQDTENDDPIELSHFDQDSSTAKHENDTLDNETTKIVRSRDDRGHDDGSSSTSSTPNSQPFSERSKKRRKSSLNCVELDDEITFKACILPPTSEIEVESVSKPKRKHPKNFENPNTELMQNIAFLRSCVNYIMRRLGYKRIHFRKPVSLPWLMSQYYDAKKSKQNNNSENE